ncbi:pimeloyl-ACP methyl ester carboxylesterase [Spinactinospora alkalitolerans]|uniref:Pimeloyl-ACP methyl ester carboxylesterase n=1 Tax=Spinactinospora alkalitolerans TaxID=687207 RepID=A0A852TQB1_9ACTN|nr:alpha/beta hydrolase [Spinactinospora alkalitolerans]NYE46576.1 pimeloyl-ACP methyl ester carboxylesterase [Spinactinospora alkalitolerans]
MELNKQDGEHTTTRFLDRPQGRIAYETHGAAGGGPLVVCAPGMGVLRSTYRHLAPALASAGFRVAAMDLRGHGDSDTTFDSYDDIAAATDMLALAEKLGADGPVLLAGHSMSAGAAAWAAAERPDLVAGIVMLGPFARQPATGAFGRLAMRTLLARPWGPAAWSAFLTRLHAGRLPEDFAEERARISAALRRPGAWRSFVRTTGTSHAPVEARVADVTAPALVVMGELDPDFGDPKAEAEWIAQRLHGTVVMVPEAGHYPQTQRPDLVCSAVTAFAAEVRDA